MKHNAKLVIAVLLAIAAIYFFFLRTSNYSLSPGSIQTDQGDKNDSIFDLKTDLTCVPGNTAVGQDGSKESYYTKQDGTGYGICGAGELVKSFFGYKILSDESALGE